MTGGGLVLLTPSCTASLEMSSLLARIEPGDEVIVPSFTFTSAALAIVNFGGVPVFVDIDPISKNIDVDYKNGIIAIWHDESHMNRYFIDNKPTTILSPSYCYGEPLNIPYEKKILALVKDHSVFQK